MSADVSAMTPDDLTRAVHAIIAEVLFVAEDEVAAHKFLLADLGAESIDFLDLVFRLEDVLGKKITTKQFDQWIRERLAKGSEGDVTVGMITEFALEQSRETNTT